jgi:hypothetical protein
VTLASLIKVHIDAQPGRGSHLDHRPACRLLPAANRTAASYAVAAGASVVRPTPEVPVHVVHARPLLLSAALVATGAAAAVAVSAPAAAAGGRPLTADLTGAAEVPGPGDPDGSGTASVRVNPGLGEVCFELSVTGIASATAAHIHEAPAGQAGPIVVTLAPPTDGTSSGCVDVGRALAREIVMDPDEHYVNVHNAEFRAGALRGQLG